MLLIACFLHVVSTPIFVLAANEIQPEVPTLAVPAEPQLPAGEQPAVSPSGSEGTGFLQNPGAPVPEKQSLVGLIGKAEITVLENVDWQFVKSMDESQVVGEEFASQAGETDLARSIRAGRSFSRESLSAAARTDQARARTGQALGLLLPSVTLRANYGTETSAPSVELDDEGNPIPKDTHDRTDVAWTLRQPLFDLPGYLDWRRRQVIEQASHENYRVSDGDAYLATTNAYLSLVSTRLQTDLTRDFEKQLADLLSYIEKRAKGGAASVSDMARVRARSQETLSFRLEQEAAHEAAGIDFVRLTNLVPGRVRLPEFSDIGADNLPGTFNAAVATAMQSNPEVTGLTAETRAAEIDKKVAKSQFLPRLDAEYTDTYSQHAGGDTESDGQRDKRGMLVLSWSPLNGGRDYQYYLERTARHKELQYRLDDERRRVVQALSANYSTLAITRERIKSGYKELKSISVAVEAMSKRMLSGNQSLLDLLDVYDRFYQARSRLVDLHILEMYTMAQLVRLTTGTPAAVPVQDAALVREDVPAATVPEKSVELSAIPQSPAPAERPEKSPLPAKVDVPPKPPVAVSQAAATAPPATPVAVVPARETSSSRESSAPVEPVVVKAPEPVVVKAPEPVAVKAPEPVAVKAPEPVAVKAPEPVAVATSGGTPQTAGTAGRSLDDAYAPLWLDIIPQTGTAFAVKNSAETAGSADDRGAVADPARGIAARSPQAAVSVTSSGSGQLSLGLIDTGDQAKVDQFVLEVEGKLGQPVKVQLFPNEGALVQWFRGLGAVDLVVIPVGERGDLLAGDYALLQTLPQPDPAGRRELLVARRDLPAAQLQRLSQAFGTKP